MTKNDKDLEPKGGSEGDTEGHSLLDTDYYIQRKAGRDAEIERQARERRQIK